MWKQILNGNETFANQELIAIIRIIQTSNAQLLFTLNILIETSGMTKFRYIRNENLNHPKLNEYHCLKIGKLLQNNV